MGDVRALYPIDAPVSGWFEGSEGEAQEIPGTHNISNVALADTARGKVRLRLCESYVPSAVQCYGLDQAWAHRR